MKRLTGIAYIFKSILIILTIKDIFMILYILKGQNWSIFRNI